MCAKYYELRYGICSKKIQLVKVGAFAWYSIKISIIFGVRFERWKVHKKKKPARKLKHANSILDHSEYFCQMSSKQILIISSYTVSKLVRFFEIQWSKCDSQPGLCHYTSLIHSLSLHDNMARYKCVAGKVAWYGNGYGVGLVINRLRVQFLTVHYQGWMGKSSWYVLSHPGQFSLPSFLSSKMTTGLSGWG